MEIMNERIKGYSVESKKEEKKWSEKGSGSRGAEAN
jgi:hypothetical protein